MDAIRQYVLSVVCVAALCGIVQMLFAESKSMAPLVKMIAGLILSITVISPLLRDEVMQLDSHFESLTADSTWAVSEGEEAALETISELIKQKTETYILDKAAAMGVEITTEVELVGNNPPIPSAVKISGAVSPYIKKQLSTYLQQELGIAEESQTWIS